MPPKPFLTLLLNRLKLFGLLCCSRMKIGMFMGGGKAAKPKSLAVVVVVFWLMLLLLSHEKQIISKEIFGLCCQGRRKTGMFTRGGNMAKPKSVQTRDTIEVLAFKPPSPIVLSSSLLICMSFKI